MTAEPAVTTAPAGPAPPVGDRSASVGGPPADAQAGAQVSSGALTSPGIDRPEAAINTPSRRLQRWLFHRLMRALMAAYGLALSAARLRAYQKPRCNGRAGCEVLLTGRFDAANWATSHLVPLAASTACREVWVVSSYPLPSIPRVVVVYPPACMVRAIGATPSRLLVFAWLAIRRRPDVVGGFHLLVNGLMAILLARLIGARSLYFCVGGSIEILGGGVWGDRNPFSRMETPDPVVESRLLGALRQCDLIVTMGTRARAFLIERGVKADFHVVSGGIDAKHFAPADQPASVDVILVGRLAQIKRVDVFLRAIKHAATRVPAISAAIVGDGPLREELEQLARELGLQSQVRFLGHQHDVGYWLHRAKVFALTSDSEGLSLALMEAMMCGLPAVVSRVGELPDLVEDQVSGYLVERRSPEQFGERLADLLLGPARYAAFSMAARCAALRHEVGAVVRQWDQILGPKPGPSRALTTQRAPAGDL